MAFPPTCWRADGEGLGKRLDVYLDKILFKPLKMSFQTTAEQLPRLADALDADPLKVAFWKSARVEAGPGKRYRLGGAGSVFTAEDYFRFTQMMLHKGRRTHPVARDRRVSCQTISPVLGHALPDDWARLCPGSTRDAMWAGGRHELHIDAKEKTVGVFLAAGPSTRQHTRFLFKNLIYGGLVD